MGLRGIVSVKTLWAVQGHCSFHTFPGNKRLQSTNSPEFLTDIPWKNPSYILFGWHWQSDSRRVSREDKVYPPLSDTHRDPRWRSNRWHDWKDRQCVLKPFRPCKVRALLEHSLTITYRHLPVLWVLLFAAWQQHHVHFISSWKNDLGSYLRSLSTGTYGFKREIKVRMFTCYFSTKEATVWQ